MDFGPKLRTSVALLGLCATLTACNNTGPAGTELAGSLPAVPPAPPLAEETGAAQARVQATAWRQVGVSGQVFMFPVERFAESLDIFIKQTHAKVTSVLPLTKVETYGILDQQTAASVPYAFLVVTDGARQ